MGWKKCKGIAATQYRHCDSARPLVKSHKKDSYRHAHGSCHIPAEGELVPAAALVAESDTLGEASAVAGGAVRSASVLC